MRAFWAVISACFAFAVLLAGCGQRGGATSGAAFPPVQVVAVEARQQPVIETLSLVGTLTANEAIEIKSEIDGTVDELLFEEGKPAEKGALLVRMDENKLAAAVAEAEANFKLSQANYERSRQLFQDKLISQQEFDQLASTFEVNRAGLELKKRQLKDARIYAPFRGIMGSRQVSPGQVISKNTLLSTLVDFDPIKAEIGVPERFVSQLQVGQKIELAVATYNNQKFPGEVYFVAPQVELSTRTALVKARLANPGLKLRPGMFANLDITVQTREKAVVIPEVALVLNGDRTSVFVVDAESKAQMRPVKTGLRLTGRVEILEGLRPGEKVIVEGIQKVPPGAKVILAPAEKAAVYLQPETGSSNRVQQ